MIIKVLARENNKAHLVLQGEGHTFMNALTDEILRDPAVDVATYTIEFQFSDPELLVMTKGRKDPLIVIRDACRRLSKQCDKLVKGLGK